MTREQQQAVKDAASRLAQVPHFSGLAIVLFTRDFTEVQLATNGVRDELVDRALEAFVRQRVLARSPIIVPGG